MEKKFKPFDKVIYKLRHSAPTIWHCGIFSDYNKQNNHITLCSGFTFIFDKYNILPYEGNEELVGTSYEPEESIKLEEGELVVAKTDNGNWVLANYKEHSELPWNNIDVVFSNGTRVSVDQIIRFSDFNTLPMEEIKKHILCVKNGKIIRYKD